MTRSMNVVVVSRRHILILFNSHNGPIQFLIRLMPKASSAAAARHATETLIKQLARMNRTLCRHIPSHTETGSPSEVFHQFCTPLIVLCAGLLTTHLIRPRVMRGSPDPASDRRSSRHTALFSLPAIYDKTTKRRPRQSLVQVGRPTHNTDPRQHGPMHNTRPRTTEQFSATSRATYWFR